MSNYNKEEPYFIRQEVLERKNNKNYEVLLLNLSYNYSLLTILLIVLISSVIFITDLIPVSIVDKNISLYQYLLSNFSRGFNFV